ncbi:MAG TPA: DinB family protein [Candidatus Dormibacteraeota bacterium]|nr:DinB family protein [Candidatus Dormibacteraeota bacterium]
MDAGERARMIARYRDGFRAVRDALEGITEAELDQSATAGEWTPRQVVHHLADAEIQGSTRIRRILAETDAQIRGYNEKTFTERLSRGQPIGASLAAMRWARESTAELLERMTVDDWSRAGTHSERGRFSTEDWLALYASHAHDHADQIRRARGKT